MVDSKVNALALFRKQLDQHEVDIPRELLKRATELLMSADADGACGAGYGERSDERVNWRNGYRQRDWDTRAGTIALDIPKLRHGSYFPDWLLEPRRRAERALTQVIIECYVRGVTAATRPRSAG